MLRKFANDRRGNFSMMMVVASVPLLGALAMAVDYTEMSRQKQATLNALDAAGIATARYITQGAEADDAKKFAQDFFEANLGSVDKDLTVLDVLLPADNTGGGTLILTADLQYKPYFFPGFKELLTGSPTDESGNMDFQARSEIRLKNTLEVALVLDNSGSMKDPGTGSGKKRIDLLKEAAKELVDQLAKGAEQMKQVAKPVQFGLVPFAATVNVGPGNVTASWMDTDGISPIHHENFDWSYMGDRDANKRVEKVGDVYYKKGNGWLTEKDQKVTRFTLYKDMQYQSGMKKETRTRTERQCTGYWIWQTCKDVVITEQVDVPDYSQFAAWSGCVEARPYPYNVNDAAPVRNDGASLFVPMFAPDESSATSSGLYANNNWSDDLTDNSSHSVRQRYTPKYFDPIRLKATARGSDEGPNMGCTTKPITPLVDVSNAAGKLAIKTAIDAMQPLGGTNVPEGLAWGWRVVSSAEPFTGGRPEIERGNDKVVIVLTDGANTYYTPGSVLAPTYTNPTDNYNNAAHDQAGNKSTYSAYGYTGTAYQGGDTRLFKGTTVPKSTHTNANFTKALNEQMVKACNNAKAANVIVMTVALDLDKDDDAQKAQLDALEECASASKFSDKKLFWNATGKSLSEDFKKIGDELSNLRIVG